LLATRITEERLLAIPVSHMHAGIGIERNGLEPLWNVLWRAITQKSAP